MFKIVCSAREASSVRGQMIEKLKELDTDAENINRFTVDEFNNKHDLKDIPLSIYIDKNHLIHPVKLKGNIEMKNHTQDNYGLKATFTEQDMELVSAYRRIQKFRIKSVKQLKAGWIANVRETISLENAFIQKYLVVGKPYRCESLTNSLEGTVLKVKVCPNVELLKGRYICETFPSDEYINTLIEHNQGYKMNSKVQHFLDLLLKADRFQQHCVLNGAAYTEKEFKLWRKKCLDEREYNDSFSY